MKNEAAFLGFNFEEFETAANFNLFYKIETSLFEMKEIQIVWKKEKIASFNYFDYDKLSSCYWW